MLSNLYSSIQTSGVFKNHINNVKFTAIKYIIYTRFMFIKVLHATADHKLFTQPSRIVNITLQHDT